MRSPYFPKPAELQEGPRQGRCPGAAGARDRADPEGQEERAPLQGRALDPSSSRENPSVPGVLFGPALPGALRPHASTHHSSRFFHLCYFLCNRSGAWARRRPSSSSRRCRQAELAWAGSPRWSYRRPQTTRWCRKQWTRPSWRGYRNCQRSSRVSWPTTKRRTSKRRRNSGNSSPLRGTRPFRRSSTRASCHASCSSWDTMRTPLCRSA